MVFQKTETPVSLALWLIPAAMLCLVIYIFVNALSAPRLAVACAPQLASGDFPRTLTESSGKKVLIASRPMRIIPANSGMADIAVALVEPSRIAAVSSTVDEFAADRAYFAAHPEIVRFVGYKAEVVLALKPDLVLVSWQNPATTALLEEHGIAVLNFEMFRTFAGIRASILSVGNAVGEDEKAAKLAEEFDRKLAEIETKIAGRTRPRVLSYSNYGSGGYVVGAGESQDEVMRRAGAINAAADAGLKGHLTISFEQIMKLDPDWIVVVGNDGLKSPQAQLMLNEPSLAQLSAVRNRRIAVVPDDIYSSISQYVVKAVEILAKQIHKEGFVERQTRNTERRSNTEVWSNAERWSRHSCLLESGLIGQTGMSAPPQKMSAPPLAMGNP